MTFFFKCLPYVVVTRMRNMGSMSLRASRRSTVLFSGSSQFLKEAIVSGWRDAVEEKERLRTCEELFAIIIG